MQKLKFHHVGIPTERKLPDEDYSPALKIHGSGYFETPYGIEWHNFDPDNELPEVIKSMPHVAFEVDDVYEAVKGKNVVFGPTSLVEHVIVAFILDGGALVELLQFERPEQDIWPHPTKFMI